MLLLNILNAIKIVNYKNHINSKWLSGHFPDRTAAGITRRTRFLIQSGLLPLGSRLPSLRELAFCMQISPATLSMAWAELREEGIIEGRGRLGSWICRSSSSPRPKRRGVQKHAGRDVINLAASIPDRSLLPPLTEALALVAQAPDINSYAKIRITAALEKACRTNWPYESESFLATNGGFCALNETFSVLLPRGSIVAVEMPTASAPLDILERLGVTIIPVTSDAHGPCLESVMAALLHEPVAFVFQPRANGITGHSVHLERLTAMGEFFCQRPLWIIEWDALDALSLVPPASLGAWLPQYTIHIRSYSKSMSPDLRLAVVSASSEVVGKIQEFRAFGAGWTSRILQEAAAYLIDDRTAQECIQNARAIYSNRRKNLIENLGEAGMSLPENGSGFSLWIPVTNENETKIFLENNNIIISAGRKHSLLPLPYIRISYSNIKENFEPIGSLIGAAVRKP